MSFLVHFAACCFVTKYTNPAERISGLQWGAIQKSSSPFNKACQLAATFPTCCPPALRRNSVADVAPLSWLWSASVAPPSPQQHSRATLDLCICASGKFRSAAVSTPTLPLVSEPPRAKKGESGGRHAPLDYIFWRSSSVAGRPMGTAGPSRGTDVRDNLPLCTCTRPGGTAAAVAEKFMTPEGFHPTSKAARMRVCALLRPRACAYVCATPAPCVCVHYSGPARGLQATGSHAAALAGTSGEHQVGFI